jgi:hypothetical protein
LLLISGVGSTAALMGGGGDIGAAFWGLALGTTGLVLILLDLGL